MADPFVASVVASLRGITKAGVPLFVGHGNRDFLLGERFAQATGAALLPDFVVVDLYGARTLLCHGDELCTDDAEYQAYRARMRDPVTQARLLRLPYFVRRGLAWWLRRKSRNEKALKPESIMDVATGAVVAAFRQHDVRRMIHGHTHRPARHEHGSTDRCANASCWRTGTTAATTSRSTAQACTSATSRGKTVAIPCGSGFSHERDYRARLKPCPQGSVSYCKACRKSPIKSSRSSIPTEIRMSESAIPIAARRSGPIS